RHDPLVRLRQLYRRAAARRGAAGGRTANVGIGGGFGGAGGRRLPCRLSQGDARLRCLPDQQEPGAQDLGVLHTREGDLRSLLRAGEPARLGRHSAEGRARALGEDGGGRACCGGLIHKSRQESGPATATRSHFSECTRRRTEYTSERCCRAHRICGWSNPRPAKLWPRLSKSSVTVSLSQQFPTTRRRSAIGCVCRAAAPNTNSTTSILFRPFLARSTFICSPRATTWRATASLERIRWYIRV